MWTDGLTLDGASPAVYAAVGFECGPMHRLEFVSAIPTTNDPDTRRPWLVSVIASAGF